MSETVSDYFINKLRLDLQTDERIRARLLDQQNRWVKIKQIKQYTSDSEVLENYRFVVFNQKELNDLVKSSPYRPNIYLCGEQFEIASPGTYGVSHIRFIGIGDRLPVAILMGEKRDDFNMESARDIVRYIFDPGPYDTKFNNLLITANRKTEVDVNKYSETIVFQNCKIDETKISFFDSSEEIADFLTDYADDLEDLIKRGF